MSRLTTNAYDWVYRLTQEMIITTAGSMVITDYGLEQDTVDLFEIDAFGLIAHRFEQTGQAKVARATQEAGQAPAKLCLRTILDERSTPRVPRDAGRSCGVYF